MRSRKASGKSAFSLPWSSKGDLASLAPLGRLIALHVAAANPLALDSSDLDPAIVAREKAVLEGKNAGKPAHVLEKIVESGLKTYYKEVCLLDQPSIHAEHAGKTIGQAVKEAEKTVGAPVTRESIRALCPRRGDRKAGDRFRGRSCSRWRPNLSARGCSSIGHWRGSPARRLRARTR